jgi:hypothetical protein
MERLLLLENIIFELREISKSSFQVINHGLKFWFLILQPIWSLLWHGFFCIITPPVLIKRISPYKSIRIDSTHGRFQQMYYWK